MTPGGLTTVDAPLLEEVAEGIRLSSLRPCTESGTGPELVEVWSPRWAGKYPSRRPFSAPGGPLKGDTSESGDLFLLDEG